VIAGKSNNQKRTVLWAAGAIPIALLVTYWPVIEGLVRNWLHSEDYSSGILILPIVGYMIWHKRAQLRQVDVGVDWRALPVVFLALFVRVVGELGAELFTVRLSMLLFVFALTWLICGPRVIKVLVFPLVFLLLMLPLPGLINRNLTFPLQLFSSATSVELLQALNIPVFRQGNVIDLGYTQLQVVEACSGLRYILPLLTFGLLIAYFGQKRLWKRGVLVAASVPLAVLGNVVRIGGTGIIAAHWGRYTAESFFHSFSGWLVFMVCVGSLLLLNLVLKLIPESKKQGPAKPAEREASPVRSVSLPSVLVGLVLVLITTPAVAYLGEVPPKLLRSPLASFPLEFRGWTGTNSKMDPKIWKQVGGQHYVIIDYVKENKAPINFYVAYYEYQKKAGDFIHSPKLCLPGAGWFIKQNRVRRLASEDPGHAGLNLNELVVSRGEEKELVYYWYQGRNRNFTSEYAAKFYMVWDGLWHRRTDGALVRVITPLLPNRTVSEQRRTLDAFALAASRTLQRFLP